MNLPDEDLMIQPLIGRHVVVKSSDPTEPPVTGRLVAHSQRVLVLEDAEGDWVLFKFWSLILTETSAKEVN